MWSVICGMLEVGTIEIRIESGCIYISNAGNHYYTLTNNGYSYNRRTKELYARLTADNLLTIKSVVPKWSDMMQDALLFAQSVELKLSDQRSSMLDLSLPATPVAEYPVRANLMRHQIAGANMALISRQLGMSGFGLLYEMGCGKTLTALAILGAMYMDRTVTRCLVIAPTTVVPVWRKELESMATYPYVVGEMLGSTKKKRIKAYEDALQYANRLKVITINYNEVFRDGIYELLKKFVSDGKTMVILDEGHYIKSYNAKVSKACCDIGSKAAYRLLLTGTPVTNKNTDIFGLFKFIDPMVFGSNFYTFRNRYCVMGGFNLKQVVGSKNDDELTKKMYSCALRVSKKDALDLPEETTENRYVYLSPTEQRAYDSLKRQGLVELSGGDVTAALVITKMLRMQQAAGGFLRPDDTEKVEQIGTSKLDALKEVIEDVVVESEQKLVVFARFLPEVHAICDMVDKMGIGRAAIWGEIPQAERGDLVDKFQTDPECKIFIAQEDTAGLGITLHAASTAVFYSVNFNYASYAQALARIHRIGQKNPVTYIHLIALGTIDEKILKALDAKQSLADTIVDDWKKYFE